MITKYKNRICIEKQQLQRELNLSPRLRWRCWFTLTWESENRGNSIRQQVAKLTAGIRQLLHHWHHWQWDPSNWNINQWTSSMTFDDSINRLMLLIMLWVLNFGYEMLFFFFMHNKFSSIIFVSIETPMILMQNVRRHPVRRRLSFGPGSFPPRCMYKCGRCAPCYPVHVPVPPGTLFFPTEYYPEAWRCKCGNRLYMPWDYSMQKFDFKFW